MRNNRFDIHRFEIDGEDLPLAYGDVLVAELDGNDELDWEIQVVLLSDRTLEQAPCAVALRLLDGRVATGSAFVVRSRERMHVLRGAGPLEGIEPTDLR